MTQPSLIRGLTLTHPWPLALMHLGKDVENRSWHPQARGGHVGMTLALHGGKVPRPGRNKPYQDALEAWDWIVDGPRHKERITQEYRGWLSSQCTVVTGNMRSLPEGFCFRPHIVAVATLAGVSRHSTSPWASQGYLHWLLTDITPLPEPVVDTGPMHQGLWSLQLDALAKVEAQLRRRFLRV